MSKIFLSVPVLNRPELQSIYSIYQAILSAKHQVRIYFNSNDSLINRVRNVHMSVFYYKFPECDYFMSIDSDIEIMNAYASNNIFNKLIAHDLDFVGGFYAIKKEGPPKCSSILMNDTDSVAFNSGLKEVRWLSSGCWCLKRSVVEKMIKAYPELTYDGDDNAAGMTVHGLYNTMIYTMNAGEFGLTKPFKKLLSEDWSMCQRWLDIGGKIYGDTSIALNHIGKCNYKIWNVQAVQNTKSSPPAPGFELEENKSQIEQLKKMAE